MINSGAVRELLGAFIGFQVPRILGILGIRSARAWAPPGSEKGAQRRPARAEMVGWSVHIVAVR